jgi:hypothetical protein
MNKPATISALKEFIDVLEQMQHLLEKSCKPIRCNNCNSLQTVNNQVFTFSCDICISRRYNRKFS